MNTSRNKIWYEFIQAKHNVEYLDEYIKFQIKLKNWFNVLILIFSASGLMGLKIWVYMPEVACVIITIISIVKLISPHIIISDDKLAKIGRFMGFYIDHANDLEQLWDNIYWMKISEEQAQEQYYKIKKTEKDSLIDMSLFGIREIKKLDNRARKRTCSYLNRMFNIQCSK
jgi:hypothetical protein